jgi:hypothetical protein
LNITGLTFLQSVSKTSGAILTIEIFLGRTGFAVNNHDMRELYPLPQRGTQDLPYLTSLPPHPKLLLEKCHGEVRRAREMPCGEPSECHLHVLSKQDISTSRIDPHIGLVLLSVESLRINVGQRQ